VGDTAILGLLTSVVRRSDRADSWLANVTNRIEQSGPTLVTLACAFLLVEGLRGLTAGSEGLTRATRGKGMRPPNH
jgi:hypothetical protein